MAQCRATSKRSGQRCRRHAMKGKTVCHMHGGKSLAGPDHPLYISGRYSRYLPERLLEKYHTAVQSGDLTTLDQEIALIEAKTADALERMTATGEGPTAWRDLGAAYANLRRELIRPEPNPERLRSAVMGMDQAVQRGTDEARGWAAVLGYIEQRRRLVDTERRRLADEDKAISIERLMILVTAVIDVIRRNVSSREKREAMADDIRRLVSGSNGDS